MSHSRIMDADFAGQTVDMTSNQMLMQAGTSVLAQAKGLPEFAVMLIG
ncbi:MAG: flagellin [Endozoicomonas sp.]